ncbi:MAG: spoIIIJ-associated protein [Clostridiales bacterium]|nr:spoIIIJ-associated protein [Clostridiales bacterium]
MGDWVEFTAKTVSDALTEASVTLQVPSSMLVYEVLEEQKSGLLGLFSKPAKIRARVKTEDDMKVVEKPKTIEKPKVIKKSGKTEKSFLTEKPLKSETKASETIDLNEKEEGKQIVIKEAIDFPRVEQVAKKFLQDVFTAMQMKTNIQVSFDEKDGTVNINIDGDDMGVLIGKRGQTLDSLQYLTSLVINKETASYLKVKLDTENYRERRKETLENLAKNIAYKVKRTKHSVSLEPMNPYERRIIHSALQADKYVETHSEGEEPYRRVVVTLKKGYRDYNPGGNRNSGQSNRQNNSSHNNHSNNNRYHKKEHKKNFSEKETAEVKTEK